MKEYNLQQIKLEDYEKINKYYKLRRPESADSNILDLYLWKDCYPTWYFTNEYGLMWMAKSEDGRYYSSIPCCRDEDLKKCFLDTQRYFNDVLHKNMTMYVVDKAAVEILDLSEDEYVIIPDRTYADYIYDAEKLRTFSGKKYHKKKNHLNAFKRDYEGRYEFRFLTSDNEGEILEFLEKWKDTKKDSEEHEFIDSEAYGIKFLLDHEDVFDYKIGGVYVDGKLEAFTIGNYYSEEDMVYIPVEKANPKIRGLYPYICSQFLIEAYPNASKENREDDMGLEGLRKSKLSYNPIYMIEKYTIIQKRRQD